MAYQKGQGEPSFSQPQTEKADPDAPRKPPMQIGPENLV
jgi:hypothetical protein